MLTHLFRKLKTSCIPELSFTTGTDMSDYSGLDSY
jgi:hypothetical protein